MKTAKVLTILLVLILVACSSVKNDSINYTLKNDILYYKNDKIGYLKESKSHENDEQIDEKYSIVLYDNIDKDIILRDDVIKYFLKKYSTDNSEVEIYTTLIK